MQYLSQLAFGFGPREESVFYWVLFLSVVFFIVAEVILKRSSVQKFRVEVVWTIIPAVVLVLLCFSNRHPSKNLPIRADGPEHVKKYALLVRK